MTRQQRGVVRTTVRRQIPERHVRRREGAHDGGRRAVEPQVCGVCNGRGYILETYECRQCGGEGEV